MNKWVFVENDDGTISQIERSYTATFTSPITDKEVAENVIEALELNDLHKALNLNGNAAKLAKLEEKLAAREEAILRKDERIDKLKAKLDKQKEKATKRLKELKAK